MVIVSPYAKAGYTDSTPAASDSLLAFVEHMFGLPSMGSADAGAYDYANIFSFGAAPAAVIAGSHPMPTMVMTPIPRWERRHLTAHPPGHSDT